MNNEKSRKINYRAFAFGAIIMVSIIFFVRLCFISLWHILPICLEGLGFGLYFGLRKSFGKLIYFASVFVIAIGVGLIAILCYNANITESTQNYTCRVDSIYSSYENSTTVVASNLKTSKSYRGKVLLTIYGECEIKQGDKVSFDGKIVSLDVKDLLDGEYALYKNNIKYTAKTNVNNVKISSGKLTIFERIKQRTKTNIISVMGDEIGGVAYALMFGDKSMIESDIYSAFRASGTAHLLAISGLHIAILIGIIYLLIEKINIRKLYKFLIMFGLMFLYCFMCGFGPSVVRASVMGLVMIGCKLLGKKYDSLNSLGLACMMILLVRPMAIFDVGFLLSFVAVFAIILFSKTLDKINIKQKWLKNIITTMLLTTIITIMTYPITASFFGEVAIYSVLANLVVIPLFSAGYILLFISNLLAYIGLKVLLFVPKGIFGAVIIINKLLAKLPGAVVRVAGVGIALALLIYIAIIIASRFINLKVITKVLSCFAIFAICATIILVGAVTQNNISKVSFDCNYYSAVVTSFGGKNYLVSPKLSPSFIGRIKESLTEAKIDNLDGIIFCEGDSFETTRLQNLMADFGGPIVYVPSGHKAIIGLESAGLKYDTYDDGKALDGNVHISKHVLGDSSFVMVVVNGKKFGFAGKDFEEDNLQMLDFGIDYFCFENVLTNEYIGDFVYTKKSINCR